MSYEPDFCVSRVHLIQNCRIAFAALCTLVKKGFGNRNDYASVQLQPVTRNYRDPDQLQSSYHTEFIRNAYLDEFVDRSLCPEEEQVATSERWI